MGLRYKFFVLYKVLLQTMKLFTYELKLIK